MNKQTTGKLQQSVQMTEFHLRCLERRVGECNNALREALTATCDAETEAPSSEALRVVHATLDAAQKLTEVALGVSTILKSGPQ